MESVRNKVLHAPTGTFFRPADFVGSRPAVLTALSRLRSEDKLVWVRNGLYWKSVNSKLGNGRPDSSAAAVAIAAGRGVGPTGWTATQALGLSTQVPAVAELAVTGKAPKLDGVRFHTRNNLARLDLSYLEVALLETLREFPRYAEVDFDELSNKVNQLELDKKVNFKKIEKVAVTERSPKLRENLETLRNARAEVAAVSNEIPPSVAEIATVVKLVCNSRRNQNDRRKYQEGPRS